MEEEPKYRKTKPPKEFSAKLTVEERLIGGILHTYPSVTELRGRPDIVMPSLEEYLSSSTERLHQLLKQQVEAVLGDLTGRERFVLKTRFGLEDGKITTPKEVGQLLQPPRSESTVRRIEKRALDKLRNHPKRSKLDSFLE